MDESSGAVQACASSGCIGDRTPRSKMSFVLTVFGVGVPACILAVVGIGSIVEPFTSGQLFAAGLGVRLGNALQLTRFMGCVELGIAVTLCLWSGRSRLPTCAAGVVFFLLSIVVFRVLQLSPKAATCGCFGSLLGRTFAYHLVMQMRLFGGLVLLALAQALRPMTRLSPTASIGPIDGKQVAQ